MAETPPRTRDRSRQPNRPERELGEITTRLQHQVNELVERVTGVRQVRRQYLTIGLTVGILTGVVVGIFLGMVIHSLTHDPQN
ncbi:MAG: hypothetical protein ACOYL5_00880 [Phototrophicaceae bacterium]|jgi:tetrahydromethanopterin S-methyltransferase subunit G